MATPTQITKRVVTSDEVPGTAGLSASTWGATWGSTWGATWGGSITVTDPTPASPALAVTKRVAAEAALAVTKRVPTVEDGEVTN